MIDAERIGKSTRRTGERLVEGDTRRISGQVERSEDGDSERGLDHAIVADAAAKSLSSIGERVISSPGGFRERREFGAVTDTCIAAINGSRESNLVIGGAAARTEQRDVSRCSIEALVE